jgi:hypothetical protein
MIPIYNSENELSHWVSIQRMLHEKKQEKEKEQLIREPTKQQRFQKEFLILSHNLRAPQYLI